MLVRPGCSYNLTLENLTMKKTVIIIAVATAIILIAGLGVYALNKNGPVHQSATNQSDKVYVASEDGGEVDVIDVKSNSVVAKIDLSLRQDSGSVMYMAHNVQVAPDGKSVWVTANAMTGGHMGLNTKLKNMLFPTAYADNGHMAESAVKDQLVVIDPLTDKVTKRIDIGAGLHLAHVVLTPDSKYAVAVSQEKGEIYKVDASTYQVVKTIPTKQGDKPHGLRIAPDGQHAYIAMMGGKSIGILDMSSATLTYIPLNGAAVQTAVTSDGKYALATVYDSKSVAIYNISEGQLEYAQLPAGAKGPLQLYPTPDAKYAYVADQGNYFGQPNGDKLYKVDLDQRKVVATTQVGTAPHGVVVSPDGKHVYVTNLVSNDVSVIDVATNKELVKIPTAAKPNGISYWTKK